MEISDLFSNGTQSDIIKLCKKYCVISLELFGSALTEDFNDDSDYDFLYILDKDADIGWDFYNLVDELEHLLDRKVDLVSKEFLNPKLSKIIYSRPTVILYKAA